MCLVSPEKRPSISASTGRGNNYPRKIVLLAGPSGSGKGRLGEMSGLPVVNLDDFYRDVTDPTLPRAHGIVDWDHPASWDEVRALSALVELARYGTAELPTYSISRSLQTGSRRFSVHEAPLVIAEGIFAAQLVGPLSEQGLLADAIVLDRAAPLVFGLRLARDVSQARKSLPTLIRRGTALALSQSDDVSRWAGAGMSRYGLRAAHRRLRQLRTIAEADQRRITTLPEPRHPVIRVSAVCFVNRIQPGPGIPDGDWRVLAVRKRGTEAFMQPGGKPETGETPVECAIREVREELAVNLDPETLVNLGHFATAAANEAHTRLEADVFLAPAVHNPSDFDVRAEIEEMRWFSLAEVSSSADNDAVLAPLFTEFVVPRLRELLGHAAE